MRLRGIVYKSFIPRLCLQSKQPPPIGTSTLSLKLGNTASKYIRHFLDYASYRVT